MTAMPAGGWRLAEMRKRRGLTQEQVAARMGVSVVRVSQIEAGDVSTQDVLNCYAISRPRPRDGFGGAGHAQVPAGLRGLRAADGIGPVQWEGRLLVPPRPHQYHRARSGPTEVRLQSARLRLRTVVLASVSPSGSGC